MSIATDPNDVSLDNSDAEFDNAFKEFADKRNGSSPHSEPEPSEAKPEGNGPEPKEPAAPAEEPAKEPAAPEQDEGSEAATSGNAEPDGGGQPPAGQEAPDPWADLPDDVRERIKAIERERDEAKHKASSDASRVAALSRKLQQLQTATPASAPEAPAEQPTEAQKALDKKIEQLRADYGDIAEPLIELIETQKQELNSVRTVLTGLSEERQAQVIAQETQALEARHPDWRSVGNSEEFNSWLEIQPANIQALAQSWDARETSVVLTLFKTEHGGSTGQTATAQEPAPKPEANAATGARRSQQLEGGRDVRSKPAPATSGPPEDFEAAFQYFQQKRQQASRR